MEYYIECDGNTYELVPYTLGVASKLDGVNAVLNTDKPIAEKLRKMYGAISDVLGQSVTCELIKPIEEADPNVINIVYLKIVYAYEKPVRDFNSEKANEAYNPRDLERITEFLSSLNNIDKLNKIKVK